MSRLSPACDKYRNKIKYIFPLEKDIKVILSRYLNGQICRLLQAPEVSATRIVFLAFAADKSLYPIQHDTAHVVQGLQMCKRDGLTQKERVWQHKESIYRVRLFKSC